MNSTPPDQTGRRRGVISIAVALLHVLAVWLLIAAGTIRRNPPRAPNVPFTVLYLNAPRHAVDRSNVPAPSSILGPRRLERQPSFEPPLPIAPEARAPPPELPGIAVTPPVDWNGEARGLARQRSDQEEAERRQRKLDGPSASQLDWSNQNAPVRNEHHPLGDSERFEGGELITWENDRCYWTTRGITTFGMPQTARVCKDPPKPVTDLFKDLRKKREDAAAGSPP